MKAPNVPPLSPLPRRPVRLLHHIHHYPLDSNLPLPSLFLDPHRRFHLLPPREGPTSPRLCPDAEPFPCDRLIGAEVDAPRHHSDLNPYTAWEVARPLKEDSSWHIPRQLEEAASTTARGNDVQVWREGYHLEAIYSRKFFRRKLDYLHDNPVRKGYVDRPEHSLYHQFPSYVETRRSTPLHPCSACT